MDLDQALGHAVVSTRRHPVFLWPVFVRVANPLFHLFNPVTPKFLIRPLIPLYVA